MDMFSPLAPTDLFKTVEFGIDDRESMFAYLEDEAYTPITRADFLIPETLKSVATAGSYNGGASLIMVAVDDGYKRSALFLENERLAFALRLSSNANPVSFTVAPAEDDRVRDWLLSEAAANHEREFKRLAFVKGVFVSAYAVQQALVELAEVEPRPKERAMRLFKAHSEAEVRGFMARVGPARAAALLVKVSVKTSLMTMIGAPHRPLRLGSPEGKVVAAAETIAFLFDVFFSWDRLRHLLANIERQTSFEKALLEYIRNMMEHVDTVFYNAMAPRARNRAFLLVVCYYGAPPFMTLPPFVGAFVRTFERQCLDAPDDVFRCAAGLVPVDATADYQRAVHARVRDSFANWEARGVLGDFAISYATGGRCARLNDLKQLLEHRSCVPKDRAFAAALLNALVRWFLIDRGTSFDGDGWCQLAYCLCHFPRSFIRDHLTAHDVGGETMPPDYIVRFMLRETLLQFWNSYASRSEMYSLPGERRGVDRSLLQLATIESNHEDDYRPPARIATGLLLLLGMCTTAENVTWMLDFFFTMASTANMLEAPEHVWDRSFYTEVYKRPITAIAQFFKSSFSDKELPGVREFKLVPLTADSDVTVDMWWLLNQGMAECPSMEGQIKRKWHLVHQVELTPLPPMLRIQDLPANGAMVFKRAVTYAAFLWRTVLRAWTAEASSRQAPTGGEAKRQRTAATVGFPDELSELVIHYYLKMKLPQDLASIALDRVRGRV